MELAAYRALVASLEEEARRNPDGIRRRIFGLIALGYGYVLGVLAVLVLAIIAAFVFAVKTTTASIAWKLIVPLIVVAGFILKALWVRAEPPPGMRLAAGRAPALDRRVEEIRRALRAPRPNEVVLTEDFNASVTQLPLLGVFGFPRTYLMLGLPLMYALTPAQFDAVLAHEFGHLSASHPKRGLWLYRMYQTWYRLMMQMQETQSWAAGFFERFVQWYVPKLNAYGFVMSRRDEYAADADAARVTSAAALGGALVALELRGRAYEDTVWNGIWAQANHTPEPPPSVWGAVPQLLRESDAHPDRRNWLGRALLARASENDTHPSLHERLLALGLVPADASAATSTAEGLVEALEHSAATQYLGDVAAERLSILDESFRTSAAEKWRERYEQVREMRIRLAALRAQDTLGGLDVERLCEMGYLITQLESDEAAVTTFERALAIREEDPTSHYLLGRALLERNDAAGEAHVLRAMELDAQANFAGVTVLSRYYERVGRVEDGAEILRWYDRMEETKAEAQQERAGTRPGDQFTPPQLTEADVRAFHAALQGLPGVKSVLVAGKVVEHRPDVPMLVVLIERHLQAILRPASYPELPRRFLEALTLETVADVWVGIESEEHAWFRTALRQMGGARQFTPDGREHRFGAL